MGTVHPYLHLCIENFEIGSQYEGFGQTYVCTVFHWGCSVYSYVPTNWRLLIPTRLAKKPTLLVLILFHGTVWTNQKASGQMKVKFKNCCTWLLIPTTWATKLNSQVSKLFYGTVWASLKSSSSMKVTTVGDAIDWRTWPKASREVLKPCNVMTVPPSHRGAWSTINPISCQLYGVFVRTLSVCEWEY